MLYGLLVALLVFVCMLLILVILIQQGKGGIGLGSSFGGAQMLFGGSGGQDIFQKITWTLGGIFMLGSLGLFLLGSKGVDYSAYLSKNGYAKKQVQVPGVPAPVAPTQIPGTPAQTQGAPVDNAAKSIPVAEVPAAQTPGATSEVPKQ